MKKLVSKIIAVIFYIFFAVATSCSKKDVNPRVPDLVISDLIFSPDQITISSAPTFDISGSINFTGAQKGITSLRLTSSLGTDLTVPVAGVNIESGQLQGLFTFTMINVAGTYTFSVWIVDGSGRSSNILTSSFEIIKKPVPIPITLLSVTWDNLTNSPLLSWSESTDPYFNAYVVTYHTLSNAVPVEVLKVYDRHVTTALAAENLGAIGFSHIYQVGVSNGDVLVQSNEINFNYPATLPLNLGAYIQRPILSATRNEMYLVDQLNGVALKAVSTQSNQIIRSYDHNGVLALSRDDLKLYIAYSNGPDGSSLTVLNATNFNILKTTNINYKANPFMLSSMICGRSDRIYAVTSWPTNGLVKILDANTGDEINELEIVAPNGLLSISPDGNTLYIADPSNSPSLPIGTAKIYKVDISADVGNVISQREASDYINAIQVSSDGQILYVAHDFDYPASSNNFVDVWSTSDFHSITKFNFSHQVTDFIVTNTSLFAVTISLNTLPEIIQMDILTNTVNHSWKFSSRPPRLLQVSQDEKFLYAFEQDTSWIVNLSP